MSMTLIEWPKRSGRIAEYDEFEIAEVRALLHSGAPTAAQEVEFLHALKVDLGATIRPWTTADGRSRLSALPFPADTPVNQTEGMSR
jgi:hypothetical protein